MTHYSWLWSGEPWWHWFVHELMGFAIFAIVLAPAWAWVRRLMDPTSKGGAGNHADYADPERPLHVAYRETLSSTDAP